LIIHKEPISVETISGKPNENFGEYENVFVVDDDSELGKKVLENQPHFNLVLDAQENLIDITPTERPPEPTPEPTEVELLKAELDSTKEAVNFLLMNSF